MCQSRRNILRGTVSTAVLSVAVAAGILRPRRAEGSGMRESLTKTLLELQAGNPVSTDSIRLKAPDIAEDGASVFIDISCALPDVEALFVFADRNPQPLIAAFQITPEVVPAMQMRVKLSRTSGVWVIARSAGQFYRITRTVKVTTGGCGVGLN